MSKDYNSGQLSSFFDEKPKSPIKDMDVLDLSYSKVHPDTDNRVDMFEYGQSSQPYDRISFSGFNDSFGLQGLSALNGVNGVNGVNHGDLTGQLSGATRSLPTAGLPDNNHMSSLNMAPSMAPSMAPFKQEWDDDDTLAQLPNPKPQSTAAMVAAARRERPRTKSAHNVIEQRYRNKINDKFTALQNLVPTLRVIARKKPKARSDDDDDDDEEEYYLPQLERSEDLEGLEPARKLNKGTILAKSVEYIKFLERKNDRMKLEHQQLVERARMLGIVLDDSLLDMAAASNHDR